MNKERLELVCKKLDSLPEHRFDYRLWVGPNWGGEQDLSCGTTACALGWAATIPELQKAGLCLMLSQVDLVGQQPYPYVGLVDQRPVRRRDTNTASVGAAAIVFELDEDEVRYLFMPCDAPHDDDDDDVDSCERPHNSATPKEVAAHIRAFIELGMIELGAISDDVTMSDERE